jgi:hypothetical protein
VLLQHFAQRGRYEGRIEQPASRARIGEIEMQPGDLVGLRKRLHDAVRGHFARRPLRLQLIAADQPAVGARGFVEKQRHGLQLWHYDARSA